MKTFVVQYRCSSEALADENEGLVADLFAELAATSATGFAYSTYRLDDRVSFVHVLVELDEEGTDLASVPAFQRFQHDIAARIDGPPAVWPATIVGLHRFLPERA